MKLTTMLLLIALVTFSAEIGSGGFSTSSSASAEDAVSICGLHSLPLESYEARERWNAEKPLTCPGVAIGRFANADLSYAFLLVFQQQSRWDYKLVVFDPEDTKASFDMRIIENSDNDEPDLFIHSVRISKFADEVSRRGFHIEAIDGILFVDASANEYESDLYFWIGGGYEHEPIDY